MTAPTGTDNASTGTNTTDPGQQSTSTEPNPTELSHEAALAELKRARDDAAKYRARAREFGDDETYKRAKDAVAALDKVEQDKKTEVERLTEAKEGLLHRATSAEQSVQKLRIALAAGIDSSQVDEFASRLRGDTEDELKADAATLAKFFGSSQTTTNRRSDPSQGNGGDTSQNADPIQAALQSKLGIG